MGYFELGVTITPSHFISKNTYYLLTLTEKINYNFEICINLVLPSKVRVKITPTLTNPYHANKYRDRCRMGRRWDVNFNRCKVLLLHSTTDPKRLIVWCLWMSLWHLVAWVHYLNVYLLNYLPIGIVLSLNSWFPLLFNVNFLIVNKNMMPDIKLLFADKYSIYACHRV